MPIPANAYFTITPATTFKSKAEAQLAGIDYFFYVADNNDLRVQIFGGTQAFTLVANVTWMGVIPATSVIHVYFSRFGQVWYFPFQQFGAGVTPTNTGIGSAFLTFSVNQAPNATPPAFLLLIDDGQNHNLYVASDPVFRTLLAAQRVYSNFLDHTHFVTNPTISVHPQDTDVATINTQQIKVSDGSSKVGFYVIQIPGVP